MHYNSEEPRAILMDKWHVRLSVPRNARCFRDAFAFHNRKA